uniref:PA domain-containing protein n=1 Tax=Neobodo designis TaxID=312471 RepID=A0A7S1VZB9_NEODS|mmetsp:Transcript_4708/g.14926  ORF Transcript_4708/g.14926 Transcript_4708/m.14926 type:complete len:186 (+) Transcript_4708:40-597(+)
MRGLVVGMLTIALVCLPTKAYFHVIAPSYLAQSVSVSWGPFGPLPTTADWIRGVVVLPDASVDGCTPVDALSATVGAADWHPITRHAGSGAWGAVVLLPRGGCTFAAKGRNFQRSVTADGYPVVAVAVHNTAPEDDDVVFITDDGEGNRNRIPTLHLKHSDTLLLREHLRVQRDVPVIVGLGSEL